MPKRIQARAGEEELVLDAGFFQRMENGSAHHDAHWGVMGGTGTWPLVIPAVGYSDLPGGVGQALAPHAPGAESQELL